MAQNIALNIILNGVPQAVSNIEELEIKLKQAKLELTQIAIGSDAFKKLSAEIQIAESKLKTLQKSAEGKDLEGKLGDLARLGGAIGASFGAATAAFALFGEESEDTTKALAQAQNALVIALAAREAAEGAVVVKTIANDIATKAMTLSTNAANKVTKAFYTTLASNPYLAIVAAVGLVVGALIALTGETEDATKAQKEFNEALTKDIATEVSKFDALKRTVENVNLSLGTRKKALSDLRAQFPAYFKDLKDEDILAGKVKVQYDNLRNALIQTATARAYQNRIQKETEQLITIEDKYTAAVNERIKLQKQLQDLQNAAPLIGGGGITSGQVTSRGGEEVILINRLNDAKEREKELDKEIKTLRGSIAKDAQRISDIQIKTDKYTGDILEKETKTTQEKEKQVLVDTRALYLQEQLTKAIEEAAAALQFESISQPTILKNQEELLSNLKSIADNLEQFGMTYQQTLSKVFFVDTKQFDDLFKKLTDQTGFVLKELKTIPTSFKEIQDAANKLNIGDISIFSPEQQKDVVRFFSVLQKSGSEVSKLYQQIGLNITNEQGFEIFRKQLSQFDQEFQQVRDGQMSADELRIKLENQYLELLAKQKGVDFEILKGKKAANEEEQKAREAELEKLGVSEDVLKTILASIEALVNFTTEVDKQGVIIEENNKKIEKQVEGIKALIGALSPEQTAEFLKSLGVDVVQTFQFIAKNFDALGPDLVKKLSASTKFLMDELDGMSKEQLLKLKKGLAEAQKEFETKAPEIAETINDTIGKIDFKLFIMNAQEAIAQFQSVLNSLSQTTSLYFSAQFDQLEKRYKRLQDSIVGDSEAANQKRLEAEKTYQQQKMELEKKAAKTALRISLAQALANTAEAITKLAAITGGIGAVIGAGAIVAFNAAQVAIIGNQLATIDSYKRGGRIKSMAGGGFITGPSHEYGGVKFQGGGVELEGNESVINRVSTINYMGLLNQINQAGGGRPIGPGFDDSRIVEAIAKQRNTPIRAYVVESDITAKQETARRLEKLSQI